MSDPADLSNLRDIVVPPAVSFWPPAPGWWLVGAACLVAAAFAIAAVAGHRRRNAYRREALRQLESADARDISAILKRAALAAFPREQVASLSGPAWLTFLDRTGGTKFTATALASMPYGGSGDRVAVIAEARRWITSHSSAARNRRAVACDGLCLPRSAGEGGPKGRKGVMRPLSRAVGGHEHEDPHPALRATFPRRRGKA